MSLRILVGAVLDWDGVCLQGVIGLDADEEGTTATGGHTLAGEEGGLEAAGESAFQLKFNFKLFKLLCIKWYFIDIHYKDMFLKVYTILENIKISGSTHSDLIMINKSYESNDLNLKVIIESC